MLLFPAWIAWVVRFPAIRRDWRASALIDLPGLLLRRAETTASLPDRASRRQGVCLLVVNAGSRQLLGVGPQVLAAKAGAKDEQAQNQGGQGRDHRGHEPHAVLDGPGLLFRVCL